VGTVAAVLAAVLVAAPLAASVGRAGATPIDDKRAAARRLQNEIDTTGDRISALGERYDGAVLAVQRAQRAITDARVRLADTQRRWSALKQVIGRRAAALYVATAVANPLDDVDVSSLNELMTRSRYSAIVAARDQDLLATLQATKDDLHTRQAALVAARTRAEHERDAVAATRTSLEALNAREHALLGQVKGELARLIAQERAREEAAARARAAAEATRLAAQAQSRGNAGNAGWNGGPIPAPSRRAGRAVAYARAQLGKPYIFNTAGPKTFDCSGLTMMAWRAAGVVMDHYSGDQFTQFPHIPLRALQPGDLVFKGPGGSVHVAIYVGHGMQIAATHTGSFVLLQPVDYAHLSGAVRPG
jgi:cell wall-associated NlpC family hydrolase